MLCPADAIQIWQILINFYLVHDKALIIMVIKLTVSCRVPVAEQLSSHN